MYKTSETWTDHICINSFIIIP